MGISAKALALKALQTLLIARVLVAPVALLAAGGGEALGTVLVVRACAWAAHESRLSGRSVVECRMDCPKPSTTGSTRPPVVDASPLASASPSSSRSSLDRYSRRSIARLRC